MSAMPTFPLQTFQVEPVLTDGFHSAPRGRYHRSRPPAYETGRWHTCFSFCQRLFPLSNRISQLCSCIGRFPPSSSPGLCKLRLPALAVYSCFVKRRFPCFLLLSFVRLPALRLCIPLVRRFPCCCCFYQN